MSDLGTQLPADAPTDDRSLAARRRPSTRRRVRAALVDLPAAQVVAVVALFVLAATTISGFLGTSGVYSTLILAAFLGIAAAGQTIVIILGGIDLSVPAVISGANLMAPLLIGKGVPLIVAFAAVLAGAAALGALNGFLIKRLGLQPLVFTLATGTVITGLTLAWSHTGAESGNIPGWLASFSSPVGHTFGISIPPVIILWVVLAIILGVVLHRTVTGRRFYATASNESAAATAGVRTTRMWVGAFVLSAVAAAVLGILLDGFVGAPTVGVGSPYLFTSLTAVMVGGTSLIEGRGDYWRTVLGALIVEFITTVLVSKGASEGVQELLFGVLILVFVGLYGRDRRIRDRV